MFSLQTPLAMRSLMGIGVCQIIGLMGDSDPGFHVQVTDQSLHPHSAFLNYVILFLNYKRGAEERAL